MTSVKAMAIQKEEWYCLPLEGTWEKHAVQVSKTTIQVGTCRTPDVTDTESKFSKKKKLSSSLGTKTATVLINTTILFYSTPTLFSSVCSSTPYSSNTIHPPHNIGTAMMEKEKRSFKPSLTSLWMPRLRILDLIWWECSGKIYKLYILHIYYVL